MFSPQLGGGRVLADRMVPVASQRRKRRKKESCLLHTKQINPDSLEGMEIK